MLSKVWMSLRETSRSLNSLRASHATTSNTLSVTLDWAVKNINRQTNTPDFKHGRTSHKTMLACYAKIGLLESEMCFGWDLLHKTWLVCRHFQLPIPIPKITNQVTLREQSSGCVRSCDYSVCRAGGNENGEKIRRPCGVFCLCNRNMAFKKMVQSQCNDKFRFWTHTLANLDLNMSQSAFWRRPWWA